MDFSRLQLVLDALEPGEHVLDSGCGPGFLAGMLKEHGVDVVGTDVSRVGPERTRARGVEAQQVDLDTEPLPFQDGSFDAVVANSNLEHLFFLRRHVAECVRCVRPGGKFIWLVPNFGHWRYRLWLLRGRLPSIPNSPTDEYHIRYVTAHEAADAAPGGRRDRDPACAATRARGAPASTRASSRAGTPQRLVSAPRRAARASCARRSSPATSASPR